MIVRAFASPPTRAGLTQTIAAALVATDLGEIAHRTHALVQAERHVESRGEARVIDDVAGREGLFDRVEGRDRREPRRPELEHVLVARRRTVEVEQHRHAQLARLLKRALAQRARAPSSPARGVERRRPPRRRRPARDGASVGSRGSAVARDRRSTSRRVTKLAVEERHFDQRWPRIAWRATRRRSRHSTPREATRLHVGESLLEPSERVTDRVEHVSTPGIAVQRRRLRRHFAESHARRRSTRKKESRAFVVQLLARANGAFKRDELTVQRHLQQ